jgi:hypothetical protein
MSGKVLLPKCDNLSVIIAPAIIFTVLIKFPARVGTA